MECQIGSAFYLLFVFVFVWRITLLFVSNFFFFENFIADPNSRSLLKQNACVQLVFVGSGFVMVCRNENAFNSVRCSSQNWVKKSKMLPAARTVRKWKCQVKVINFCHRCKREPAGLQRSHHWIWIVCALFVRIVRNQKADASHRASFCKTLFKIKIHGNKKSRIYS